MGLICRLYEKAAQRLEQAKAHLDEGKSAAAGEAVARAMEIVLELMSSLDTDEGGQIAADLASLYFYVQQELAEAAVNQRIESIENALRVMNSLHEGWKGVSRETAARSGESGASGGVRGHGAGARMDSVTGSIWRAGNEALACFSQGPSVQGARRLTSGGVLEQSGEHGEQAQRSNGGPIVCFARQAVRNAG